MKLSQPLHLGLKCEGVVGTDVVGVPFPSELLTEEGGGGEGSSERPSLLLYILSLKEY